MKKLFSFDTFWFLLIFTGNAGIIMIILFCFDFTFNQHVAISGIISLILTKMELNKVDLDQKLFEIKELLNSKND